MILSELWNHYEDLLKEYLAKQSDRLKPSSLGHRIRFVRSLFRFAYEETYLSSNPSIKLREPKMEKRVPKFLMEEDVIHLKISCQTLRKRALLEFLYCTGCRIGEVEKLNIEDLNWENCSAIVNGKGRIKFLMIFKAFTKNGIVWAEDTREDVDAVIFATGYSPNFEYLSGLNILDSSGVPLKQSVQRIHFVCIPWQTSFASATIRGSEEDAKKAVSFPYIFVIDYISDLLYAYIIKEADQNKHRGVYMEQKIQEMAEAYKLLADKTRLTIVALLQEQELCVCDITDIIGMSQPNASQHLRKLKAAGLLNEKKKGQWVYYSLNPDAEAYVQCVYPYLPSMKEKIAELNNCCGPQGEV